MSIVDMILQGRTVEEVLEDDARGIKEIGDDHREKTFAEKAEYGFVTAKMFAIPKPTQR